MITARPARWRRRAGWGVLSVATVAAASWVWAAARPKVQATSDDGVGAYADRSHLRVFGADVTFMLVTGAIALLAAVVTVVVRRGRPLTPAQVLLGTLAQVAVAVAVTLIGPLLDSVSRGADQPFPPGRLPQGVTVVEPVRLHAYGSLLAGALVWLGALLIAAALRPRPERS